MFDIVLYTNKCCILAWTNQINHIGDYKRVFNLCPVPVMNNTKGHTLNERLTVCIHTSYTKCLFLFVYHARPLQSIIVLYYIILILIGMLFIPECLRF